MSHSQLAAYTPNTAAGSYGGNVRRAARDLVTALLSESSAHPTVAAAPVAPSSREIGFWELYRMNAGHDSVSPEVAEALRSLAAK